MAITLDGIDYTVDQPTDNALNLLNYINTYLTSIGSTVQFIVNAASPIWLIILGLGQMFTVYQRLVYAAGQAFSIPNCSDLQLLNLAEIKGTGLLAGSGTVITCPVTAAGTGDCVIATTDTVTIDYEGESVVFSPIYPVTIPQSTTVLVTLQTNTVGPMYIAAGAVTAFDTPPTNFASMTSNNAAPGRNMETYGELRTRLQSNSKHVSGIKACIEVIRSLPGIQTANLYFNRDPITDLIIAGVTIPPRSSALFVQGYSDYIAETYFAYMTAPCVGGSISQNYETGSGQELPVTYSPPVQRDIYINVKVRIPPTLIVPEDYQVSINLLLLPASNSLLIGQEYTQKYLLTYLAEYNSPDIEIVGITVSMDGITYSDTTTLALNEIGIISTPNIAYTEIL